MGGAKRYPSVETITSAMGIGTRRLNPSYGPRVVGNRMVISNPILLYSNTLRSESIRF
jgi:hypothetical protein